MWNKELILTVDLFIADRYLVAVAIFVRKSYFHTITRSMWWTLGTEIRNTNNSYCFFLSLKRLEKDSECQSGWKCFNAALFVHYCMFTMQEMIRTRAIRLRLLSSSQIPHHSICFQHKSNSVETDADIFGNLLLELSRFCSPVKEWWRSFC